MRRREVKPLADRRRPKPIALVASAGPGRVLVLTAEGEQEARGRLRAGALLRTLKGHMVYSASPLPSVILSTGAREWSGYLWRGSLVNVTLDGGPKVQRLPRPLRLEAPTVAYEALEQAMAWLGRYGVNPGSVGSMGWRLWRATLLRPVALYGPHGRDALYGGRQEAPMPASYREVAYWDLSAAYPASMAHEPYPLRLVQVKPTTKLRPAPGVARATVRIPEGNWCPLPVRVAEGVICYGWGTTEGWWAWRELLMAREAGCSVKVHEMWAPMGEVDLFGPWWALVRDARALKGAVGSLMKALTSALWGQFALRGDGGALVRWVDDYGRQPVKVADVRTGALPHEASAYIASETTARVRERLWREAITRLPAPIYVDTDAVMAGAGKPDHSGPKPGQWRRKERMVEVEIRAPQVYRHRCIHCVTGAHPEWHYTVAGVADPATAEHIFRRQFGPRTAVGSLRPGDLTLPAMPLADVSNYLGGAFRPFP